MKQIKHHQALALGFLVGLGSLQMMADVLEMPRVKAFAAALQVAPAMKVFTAHEGYETHAARFELHYVDREGMSHELKLDPHSYSSVEGPYNRRNVYGAAFAYGPILRNDTRLRPMQESVMQYALCNPGTLRAELGIPRDATQLTAHVKPVRETQRRDLELSWEVKCHE